MTLTLLNIVILIIVLVINHLNHKRAKKLARISESLTIRINHYSHLTKAYIEFYKWLKHDALKLGYNEETLNLCFDKFEKLFEYDQDELELDSSSYCDCKKHNKNDLEHGFCTECKRVIK